MPLNDILGIGKVLPMDKLIDVVSKSVGRLSKSYFDKKDIDNKAYEIKKTAEARAEDMKIMSSAIKNNYEITGGIEYKDESISISSPKLTKKIKQIPVIISENLNERTDSRLKFKENKKQLNLENVTAHAAEELKKERVVTDEPLDEDWTTRFFNIAEDISNEDMQTLWGRILAGEIKKPRTYSLRTLDTLKNLSKEEAKVFLRFAKLSIESSEVSFILNFRGEKLLEEKYGLNFYDGLLLDELGFLSPKDLQYKFFKTGVEPAKLIMKVGNMLVSLKKPANEPEQQIQVLAFTKTGRELLKLVSDGPDLDYVQLLASKLRKENIELKYAYILAELQDGKISHTRFKDIPLTEDEQKVNEAEGQQNKENTK